MEINFKYIIGEEGIALINRNTIINNREEIKNDQKLNIIEKDKLVENSEIIKKELYLSRFSKLEMK